MIAAQLLAELARDDETMTTNRRAHAIRCALLRRKPVFAWLRLDGGNYWRRVRINGVRVRRGDIEARTASTGHWYYTNGDHGTIADR